MDFHYIGSYTDACMCRRIQIRYLLGRFRFHFTIAYSVAGESYARLGLFKPIPKHWFDYIWANSKIEGGTNES